MTRPHQAKSLFEKWARRADISAGPDACWPWMGGISNRYGQIRVKRDGRWVGMLAHRAAWESVRFPIPNGLRVLHRCDNPPCVNPAHLFLGTQAENLKDMDAKGRRRWRSVVTEADVVEIRRLRAAGVKHKDVAARFGIEPRQARRIASGGAWRNVQYSIVQPRQQQTRTEGTLK